MLLTSQILDQYYKEHISLKAVAKRRAEYAIDALNSFFSDVDVIDIDIPLCRDYRLHRGEVSDSTVRRELGVLQAAVNHARAWRRLKVSADQLPSIELPAESSARPLWLFKEEVGRLLEAAQESDQRVYRFVQLAYHTAARKETIERLQWCQVDLPARRIDLLPPGKQATKKRQPIVPISENIVTQLTLLKEKAKTSFVLGAADNIRPAFDRAAKLAGLHQLSANGLRPVGRLTPHVLRHSRATHLLQDGRNPWAVAQLLGDTLPTLLRVYGHACSNYLAETIL